MTTKQLIAKLKEESKRSLMRVEKLYGPSRGNSKGTKPSRKTPDGHVQYEKPKPYNPKTFLYIKDTLADNGQAPSPPGTVVWESPDIEIIDFAGNFVLAHELNEGQAYTVLVTVHNDGDLNCNACTVELFMCNPSIGFSPANGVLIGIQSVFVGAHNQTVVRFPFAPDNTYVGHRCLFARAYSFVTDDLLLSANSFLVTEDRHVAQQNLDVYTQGSLAIINFFPVIDLKEAEFAIELKQQQRDKKEMKQKAMQKYAFTKRVVDTGNFLLLKGEAYVSPTAVVKKKTAAAIIKADLPIEKTQFKLIAKAKPGVWKAPFQKGLTRMSVQIPNLKLKAGEATFYSLTIKNTKTGKIQGGITLVVIG